MEDVGVDHGGFDVFVAEEFLDGADVVAALEEVGGEGVAEGVGCDAFVDSCGLLGFADGALEGGFVDVVAGGFACLGVGVEGVGGEYVLPEPVFASGWVFLGEGVGEVYFAKACGEVFLVDVFDALEVFAEGCDDAVGEHGDAVVAAFSVVDDDAVVGVVYVFDAEAQAFHES